MFADAQLRLRLANDRIARDHRDAQQQRLAEQARRRHRRSLRHSVGHRIIAIGERLVAEPSLRPARSR